MDNWYTGIALAATLMKDGISLSGTIKNNRLTNCKMLNDNDLKKNGRGSYEIRKQLLMVLISLQLIELITDP